MTAITKENFVGANYDDYVTTYDNAKKVAHAYWVDEIPVVRELHKFMLDFRYSRRDVVFGMPKLSGSRFNANGYDLYNYISVSYKDSPNVIVGAMFLDTDSHVNLKYCVKSDSIKNEKFNEGSTGYNIKATGNVAIAIKNAKTYLKPKALEALIKEHNVKITNGLEKLSAPSFNKLYGIKEVRDSVIEEVQNMIRMGYEPATAQFKTAFETMKTEGEELLRMYRYKPRMCFVWAKPDRVIYKYGDDATETTVYDLANVPQDVRNKIAVLQIGDMGMPVADVGIRITDTFFVVFV
jgi:hypothetical protein